jgi:disulfide oxidoreductase YuzD
MFQGDKMAKRGRPSGYSEEIADAICELIATSDSGLERICAAEGMPSARAVYRWLEEHEAFRQKYARARELQGEYLALQVIAIADDGSADMAVRYREDGSEYQAVDQEHISRSRLRVDARKWLASKLAPKRYGDRLELAGDKDNPLIPPKIVVEFVEPKR